MESNDENQQGTGDVFECAGWNGGILLSAGDGYFYRNHVGKDNISFLKCRRVKCLGRAVIRTENSVKTLRQTAQHSADCVSQPYFPQVAELRRRILLRSKEENTKLSVIFRDECNK